MMLIKLGGSVITDKSQYRRFDKEAVSRLCKEIAGSGKQAVVVHGAGSFGHILAKRYSLQDGYSNKDQIPAVAMVQHDVRELSSMVVAELLEAGIPAVSVPPGSCFVMDDGKLVIGDEEPIRSLLRMGIMPVLFGDVVMDRKKGFGICSGDQAMEALAKMLKPEKAIFVSDIDGLFTADPKKNPDAKLIPVVTEEVLEKVSAEQSVDDVTGGVAGKMREMLDMCQNGLECVLINGSIHGNLRDLLEGKEVTCTVARAVR